MKVIEIGWLASVSNFESWFSGIFLIFAGKGFHLWTEENFLFPRNILCNRKTWRVW